MLHLSCALRSPPWILSGPRVSSLNLANQIYIGDARRFRGRAVAARLRRVKYCVGRCSPRELNPLSILQRLRRRRMHCVYGVRCPRLVYRRFSYDFVWGVTTSQPASQPNVGVFLARCWKSDRATTSRLRLLVVAPSGHLLIIRWWWWLRYGGGDSDDDDDGGGGGCAGGSDGVGLGSSSSRVRNGSSDATKESLLSVDPPGDAPSWTVPVRGDGYAPSNLLCIVARIPWRIIFKRNRDFLRSVIPPSLRSYALPQSAIFFRTLREKHFHRARSSCPMTRPLYLLRRRRAGTRDARNEVKKNAPDWSNRPFLPVEYLDENDFVVD